MEVIADDVDFGYLGVGDFDAFRLGLHPDRNGRKVLFRCVSLNDFWLNSNLGVPEFSRWQTSASVV